MQALRNFSLPQLTFGAKRISRQDEVAYNAGLNAFLQQPFAQGEEAKKAAGMFGREKPFSRPVQDVLNIRSEKSPLRKGLTAKMNRLIAVGDEFFRPLKVHTERPGYAFAKLAEAISGTVLDCTCLFRSSITPLKYRDVRIKREVPDLLELGRKILAKKAK